MTRRRGRHAAGVVTITTAQAAVIAQALTDAASYRRKHVEDWCADCEAHPAGACETHVNDLDQADAYEALLRALAAGDGGA